MNLKTIAWIAMIIVGGYLTAGGLINWGITRDSDMLYEFKANFYVVEILIMGAGMGLIFFGGAKLIDSRKSEANNKIRSFWGVN